MELGILTIMVLIVVVSIAIGMHIEKRKHKPEPSQGIINVDCGDSVEGAYLYLTLDVPIADVVSRKRVTFDVNVLS